MSIRRAGRGRPQRGRVARREADCKYNCGEVEGSPRRQTPRGECKYADKVNVLKKVSGMVVVVVGRRRRPDAIGARVARRGGAKSKS